jgi:hypothetical protein
MAAAEILGKGKKRKRARRSRLKHRPSAKMSLKIKGNPSAVLKAVKKVVNPDLPVIR